MGLRFFRKRLSRRNIGNRRTLSFLSNEVDSSFLMTRKQVGNYIHMSENEDRRKAEIIIAPTGAYKEMSGDGCHMTNKQQYHSIQYIQNRTNWCWAVACRMVGEQFKRNHPELDFCIPSCREGNGEPAIEVGHKKEVRTNDREGLRMDVVGWDGEFFRVDPWQRAIVMNANTECPGDDGNHSGDDAAKERGLKFVVTGQCDSSLIQVVSLGFFDSRENLLTHHQEQIQEVFQRGDYMIGNAVLYPRGVCHSFVLLNWAGNDKMLIYDPWNGTFECYSAEDVFDSGISTALGTGIIKWVQYLILKKI